MNRERPVRDSGSKSERNGSALYTADPETSSTLASMSQQESPALASLSGPSLLSASKSQIVAHVDAICRSSSFASSKRSQQFLRYIVMETLEGRGEQIKERNIAHEVFGKGIDFEPGEDSLVRVKARELRKRLSEYYGANPPDGLCIEIPLGGYSPRISDTLATKTPPASGTEIAFRRVSRRKILWMAGGGVVTALAAGSVWRIHDHSVAPLDRLWAPVFATRMPLIIFIPVLKDPANGAISDRIGIGPAAALRHASDFLDRNKYPYHLRFGSDLTFAQLREQPSLLLGGFSSIWTHLMMQNLRFAFLWSPDRTQQAIIDNQTREVWRPLHANPEGYADEDYGILCRLFDKESGQIVMLAGGVTTFSTEGAASTFFNPVAFGDVIRHAPPDWERKNFQALIRVSIVGTTPSAPHVIKTYFW